MEKVQVEVKIELGHKASCKKNPSPEGFTHDWQVFVRGPGSDDISQFVEKVVFHLHESFFKPKRGRPDHSCSILASKPLYSGTCKALLCYKLGHFFLFPRLISSY